MVLRNLGRPGVNLQTALGMIAAGAVVGLSSLTIVRAERVSPANSAVYTCSSGTACVEGNSTGNNNTYGVFGNAASGTAVVGITASKGANSGVAGIAAASSGNAHGVYGRSQSGDGVFGTTNEPVYYLPFKYAGVYGTSTTTGSAPAAPGVVGSSSGTGVEAVSTGSSSFDAYGLQALATQPKTRLFLAWNLATDDSCEIDHDANLTCDGTISGSGDLRTRQRSSTGRRILAYTPKASIATIEDFGTARMFNGIANVQIPADFASVMDRGSDYYLFLTPQGDTRGLYVNIKTPAAFQVRENERGRSNVAFDYRIVAHPLGASNDRLPLAPRLHRPRMAMATH